MYPSADNRVEDNTCYTPGVCGAGEQVDSTDPGECEPCPVGRYNGATTDSTSACVPKVVKDVNGETGYDTNGASAHVASCPAGEHLVLGSSATRNDWKCTACPAGQYSDSAAAVGTNPGATECTGKTTEPPGGCSGVDPSFVFRQGKSRVFDDNECRPRAIFGVMCQRRYKENTRSTLGGLLVGMPELVEPFTKTYRASIVTPGPCPASSQRHAAGHGNLAGRAPLAVGSRPPLPARRAPHRLPRLTPRRCGRARARAAQATHAQRWWPRWSSRAHATSATPRRCHSRSPGR